VSFNKQANIAAGNQQMNNGTPSLSDQSAFCDQYAHAEKNKSTPNKLVRKATHETLDSRGTAATSATNSPMETVRAIHRRTNAGGKSKGIAERQQGQR